MICFCFFPPQDPSLLSTLLESALSLAQSTRPQDCTTAAYLLRLLVKQPSLYHILIDHLQHTSNTDTGIVAMDTDDKSNEDGSNQMHKNMEYSDNESPMKYSDLNAWLRVENSESARYLLLLRCVLDEVKSEAAAASTNLLHAAATRPMYPALHVIRYLIGDVNMK